MARACHARWSGSVNTTDIEPGAGTLRHLNLDFAAPYQLADHQEKKVVSA
jgi:hypothetical protein